MRRAKEQVYILKWQNVHLILCEKGYINLPYKLSEDIKYHQNNDCHFHHQSEDESIACAKTIRLIKQTWHI